MVDSDTKTSNRVQVASLPPSDSGRGIARLPEARDVCEQARELILLR